MVVKNNYCYYFFNSLYDDDIISNKLADYQNHMYDPILRGKTWTQNNCIINGGIKDIQINQKLNRRFNMPTNTYSIFLNVNIIPIYSEKEFCFKYGYETPITSSQIIEDDKIFSKYLYFFIGGYLIHDVKFIIHDGHTIIFIQPSSDKGKYINENDLETILSEDIEDGLWTIMFSTRSDIYKIKQQRALLFSDNKIYLSSTSVYKKYNKPNKNNCYTLYVSSFPSSYNIMSACSVSVGSDEKGEYFLVPQEFKDYIYKKTNLVYCMIFNEPDCSGSGIYVNTEGNKPIFQIPYKRNPIPINNLLIWRYDSKSHRKIHPVEQEVAMHYPNTYDFSKMIEFSYYDYLRKKSNSFIYSKNDESNNLDIENMDSNYDLYIEWIEPKQDCMSFHSYIQDYIDYDPDYCERMINNTLPSEFTENFDPVKQIPLGAFDYYNSEYYDDYRGWTLDALSKILHNNPKKYDLLYHELYANIRNYLTRCYNYENQQDIYTRSIDNNYLHCIKDNQNRVTFNKPHTYIHVFDYQEVVKPMNIFIGGKLTTATFVLRRGDEVYAYIDRDYIKSHESIQIDLELINKDIECFKFPFNSVGDAVDLESLGFKEKHSLSDIILFDEDGNYLSKDDFTFQGQVDSFDFIFNDKNEDIYSTYSEDTYFITKKEEIFVPKGSDRLIVKRQIFEFEINESDSTKITDLDDIKITPNDPKYYGKEIGIATTDFARRTTIIFTDNTSDLPSYDKNNNLPGIDSFEVVTFQPDEVVDEINDVSIKSFKGKPSSNRFKVYINGKIVSPKNYDVEFEGYDKNAIFHFHKDLMNKKIDIHYIGYDDQLIYDGEVSILLKTHLPVLFLRDIIETPYDNFVYRIYIDGYRISDDKIKPLGQNNMLYIDTLLTSMSNIMIYRQKMDKEIYGYEKDTQFLDQTAKNDSNFLNYLIDKYAS